MKRIMMFAGESQRHNHEALAICVSSTAPDAFQLLEFEPVQSAKISVQNALHEQPDVVLIAYNCGGADLSEQIHCAGFLGITVFRSNFVDPEQIMSAIKRGLTMRPSNWWRSWDEPSDASWMRRRAVVRSY